MNLKHREFTKHRIGESATHVLIDAPHASPPKADSHTGEIANQVSMMNDCHCIISTISRTKADINRPPNICGIPEAVYEYRNVIRSMLISANLLTGDGLLIEPFLHLQIHGMKDRSLENANNYNLDIEVGTRRKTTCSPIIHDWIMHEIKTWSRVVEGRKKVIVGSNTLFPGDTSKSYHRNGDGQTYAGYGDNFHTVQIEFANWLRTEHKSDIEQLLETIVCNFEETEFSSLNTL